MQHRARSLTILIASTASVLLAGSLTACSSDDTPTAAPTVTSTQTVTETATVTATPSATTSPGVPHGSNCSASEVSARVKPSDAGAGQRRAVLVLTNTGTRRCTVQGYPGMQLLDTNGGDLPTKVVRVASPAPTLVSVPPGAKTSSTLTFSVVSSGSEPENSACEATPASVEVTPPDDTAHVTAPWSLGPVCARGTIKTAALRAGAQG